MRKMLVLALVLGLVSAAAATDLGNQAPAKVPGVYPINIPNPVRQGGDTVANATMIPGLPYDNSGTTVGYNDDYTSACYFAAGAPDVVYSFMVGSMPPEADGIVISLCGSTYDTGLSVLNSSLVEIACIDDFCGLQSQLDNVSVSEGETYYIVVDGYSSASGEYVISVNWHQPCILTCPTSPDQHEGEPALNDEYVDRFNGGCNTSPGYPFQHIPGALMNGSDIPEGTNVWCGVSGWYLSAGSQYRDTDWYTLTVGNGGAIEVIADAEYASYIFELGGTCEGGATVTQQAIAGPCIEAFMTIAGAPGSTKWFWVGPTVFADPDGGDNEYDYVVWFDGLMPEVVATENATWGGVKALYQ